MIRKILSPFETLIFKEKAEEEIAIWSKAVNSGVEIILDPEFDVNSSPLAEKFCDLYAYAQETHSKAVGLFDAKSYWAAYELLGNTKHSVDGVGEYRGRSLVTKLNRLVKIVDPAWQQVYSGKTFVTTTEGINLVGAGGSGGYGMVATHGIGGSGGVGHG